MGGLDRFQKDCAPRPGLSIVQHSGVQESCVNLMYPLGKIQWFVPPTEVKAGKRRSNYTIR
eukprot:355736-Chlamydomonas_euryale.AAC.5